MVTCRKYNEDSTICKLCVANECEELRKCFEISGDYCRICGRDVRKDIEYYDVNGGTICESCMRTKCKCNNSPVQTPEPALLRVYYQTVIDNKPYYVRTEKVDISAQGVRFIGFDCDQIYLFDFNDIVSIVPDANEEADI